MEILQTEECLRKYDIVKNIVKENDCFLLTSFEEFEEKRKNVLNKSYNFVKIDIIASCFHKNSVIFTNLKLRKTGIKCKDCIKKYNKNIGYSCVETEYSGIKIINDFLKEYYEIIRMKEGCRADIAIKNLGDNKNNWIPIQIKTTNKKNHSMYSFSINNNYDNMLLILICIYDQKIWIIPYNDVKNIKKINISDKSKYNLYLLKDKEKINITINKYLNNITPNKIEVLNTPINIYQQKEQQYVKKRETYLNFLEYKYLNIQGTCIDFMINTKKIQEKVTGYYKNGNKYYLKSGISHNGGKKNNTRNIIPYNIGDNDYYWFHSSIDDRFWIIPESILISKNYIGDSYYVKRKFINFDTTDWVKSYEYNYKNINDEQKQKIRLLF